MEYRWELLEGKKVNLRVREREDLQLLTEWLNNPEFMSEYNPLHQTSRTKMEKMYDRATPEQRSFIIEKKDGGKIGYISHFPVAGGKMFEIGFALVPSERKKGYSTEAIKIMVDYLFLLKDIVRIQARTNLRNVASLRVLEKAGFRQEGIIRKSLFVRGEWVDGVLYSILREEWKEPKILTRKASAS